MVSRFLKVIVVVLLFNALVRAADSQPQALNVGGLYDVTNIDPNLTGKGVSIGLVCRSDTYTDSEPQNDYRPGISHKCFKNSKIKFYDDQADSAGVSKHSTSIASILTGFDANAFYQPIGGFTYKAAATDAQLNVYEFWHFITDYVFTGQWPKDDLLTLSLGWSSEAWWTRGIDEMVENYGFLVIAAIGNGTNAYDLPLYPAAGANVMAVGVVDSNDSLFNFSVPDANHSSTGPTLDGRCKPDIVAPGNCLVATNDSNNGYKPSGDYSSFAAPVVAGVAAVLIEKAKSDPNLQSATSGFSGNCAMKSILMTSAKKLPGWHKGFPDTDDDYEYPLDFKQGAGMVQALAAYRLLTAGQQKDGDVNKSGWDINVIEPNKTEEKIYSFVTGNQKSQFAATLVWNRSYESHYPFNLNLNRWKDLQLQLRKIDENGQYTLVDLSDSPVDNVEHIYITLDANSTYELAVSNSQNSISKDSTTYALSWQTRP